MHGMRTNRTCHSPARCRLSAPWATVVAWGRVSAVAACVLLGTGCAQEHADPARHAQSRPVMSTIARIVVWAGRPDLARAAMDDAFAELERVSGLMNPYQADSEISRVNRQAADQPVKTSADTLAVVRTACVWSRRTAGAFDVTVGPLISLWRRAAKADRLPTDPELAEMRKRMGWQHIELDASRRTIRFSRPGLRLDLGGIAKGYAIDRALAVLRRPGISAALVDVGGDLACFGAPRGQNGWIVGVQSPYQEALVSRLRARDVAVTTSGHYRRFYTVGGKRYSHIFNPLTGRPAQTIASVTVVAPSAMDADALSTAVSVLGVEKGLALLEKTPNVEGLLITGPPGQAVFHRTTGWTRHELGAD